MKRNIKFRGKCVESGEWIVGWLFQDDDDHFPMIHQGGTLDDWEQVKEETIGQFTGVLDKNGVEVCEGDIISTGNALLSKFAVEYKYGCFGYDFCSFHPIGGAPEHDYHNFESDECYFEVVGNIFDNKELIE